MKGDFTRNTFKRKKHYSSVRMQQGRVQLDADWNEQIDIQAHLDRTTHRDVIGHCGGPLGQDSEGDDYAGFEIVVDDDNLRITRGRYYVGGILCENDAGVLITEQPDLPDFTLPTEPGVYLAYLDVWQRHITALEDPEIREVALGGPDTATRTKTVWQVKLESVAESDAAVNCTVFGADWVPTGAESTGKLAARAEPGETDDEPCTIPPGAGYRRLENQTYRVEIHEGGGVGGATFKWSRENGSIVTRWVDQDGNDLTVSSAGRDQVLGFAADQWVELTDDTRELWGRPGVLVRLSKVEGQVLTIDPATIQDPDDPGATSVDRSDFPRNPKIRGWESEGALSVEVPATNDGWLSLEDGVEIRFDAGGTYQPGDYWGIPARTATGDVEWPQDGSDNPLAEPAHGIQHRYCPVALVELGEEEAGWEVIADCRKLFPPVTELTSLFYVSGDGQEAMPDPAQPGERIPLPQPLQVGVANGQWPVEGATVRFQVMQGNGRLQGAGATVEVITGPDGIASCSWELDGRTQSQQVEAALLDAAGDPVHVPILFTANLSVASQVAYDPSECPGLEEARVRTVQDAIDELCKRGAVEEPGVRIEAVLLRDPNNDDVPLENDTQVPVETLLRGIRVVCDQDVEQASVQNKPVCFVTLDLPYPLTRSDRNFWDFSDLIGYQPLKLAAEVNSDDQVIFWRPAGSTRKWLDGRLNILFDHMEEMGWGDQVLAHLTLKGNFIWAQDDVERFLDGEGFGKPGEGRTSVRLPSGDGRRGGDFEMWFWLVEK